jgi:hypothetical protein
MFSVLIMLAREDEVQFHASQTTTEQFQLYEWGLVILEMAGSWDAPDYPS